MAAPPFSPAGLRFEKIEKRYGGLFALRGVTFAVAPGECVVVAGRNGSGKTTLLRIAARLVRPSKGAVSIFDGARDEPAEMASPGFVAHATMVYDELSARENLLLFARLQGIRSPEGRVETLLHDVGLQDRQHSLLRTFSRGMRQRVAIARALLAEPSILLLDEPATGLDPEGVRWLAGVLRSMRDSGRTILMSLHGESEISSLGTRAMRFDNGSIAADTRSGATFRSILTFVDA